MLQSVISTTGYKLLIFLWLKLDDHAKELCRINLQGRPSTIRHQSFYQAVLKIYLIKFDNKSIFSPSSSPVSNLAIKW